MCRLIRFLDTGHETFGVMIVGGAPICVTLEDPWRGNSENTSCVPAGIYECERRRRPSNGRMAFYLKNVPDRTAVLIHSGNTHKDTEGCILLGKSFGWLGDSPAILSSRPALKSFMDLMGEENFELEIVYGSR